MAEKHGSAVALDDIVGHPDGADLVIQIDVLSRAQGVAAGCIAKQATDIIDAVSGNDGILLDTTLDYQGQTARPHAPAFAAHLGDTSRDGIVCTLRPAAAFLQALDHCGPIGLNSRSVRISE